MGAKNSKDRLNKDDLDFLKTNTHYDEDTINEWYKGFKQDCPDGRLDPQAFMKIYSKCFPSGNAGEFCDHVFRTFDVDKNGSLDKKELEKITKYCARGARATGTGRSRPSTRTGAARSTRRSSLR